MVLKTKLGLTLNKFAKTVERLTNEVLREVDTDLSGLVRNL